MKLVVYSCIVQLLFAISELSYTNIYLVLYIAWYNVWVSVQTLSTTEIKFFCTLKNEILLFPIMKYCIVFILLNIKNLSLKEIDKNDLGQHHVPKE